jgi:hypothetical protein
MSRCYAVLTCLSLVSAVLAAALPERAHEVVRYQIEIGDSHLFSPEQSWQIAGCVAKKGDCLPDFAVRA